MAEGSRKRRYEVRKDDGSKWVVTYGGRSGVKWEKAPDEEFDFDSQPSDLEPSPRGESSALPDPLRDFLIDLTAQLMFKGLEVAGAKVVEGVKTTAPKVKKFIEGLRAKSTEPTSATDQGALEAVDEEPLSIEVVSADPTAESYRMTSEEAQQHYEDLKLLTQLMALKTRMLSTAEIVDEPDQTQALENLRPAEAQLLQDLTDEAVEALKSDVPILGVDSPERLAWALGLIGYQVREINPVDEGNNSGPEAALEASPRPGKGTH